MAGAPLHGQKPKPPVRNAGRKRQFPSDRRKGARYFAGNVFRPDGRWERRRAHFAIRIAKQAVGEIQRPVLFFDDTVCGASPMSIRGFAEESLLARSGTPVFESCEVGFEMREGFGHVLAAVAEANVMGFVVDGAGKEQDAGVPDKVFAERQDVLVRLEADEPDGTGVGRSPLKQVEVPLEKSGKQGEIAKNDLAVAVDELLAITKGEGGEKFARGASADGGVVL